VGSRWWHAALLRARRGQAVPARGLYQGRRRHTLQGGDKRCQHEDCTKGAQGDTPHCFAHGGGKRCQHEGCTKSARGGTQHCKAHGGGKQCQEVGCSKSALGDMGHCSAHGGGKRCQHAGCLKGADGGTQHCVSRGGGRRCQHVGCPKAAASGGTPHSRAHGGGKRCQQEGCSKPVVQAPGSVYCRLCPPSEQPDDAQEGAPQQPSDAQAPQAVVGIEISLQEFQEILRRQMDTAGQPSG
jgi:hypothetical protein